MSILYITDQGAMITKLDGRVVVRKRQGNTGRPACQRR